MEDFRIKKHPVLPIEEKQIVSFYFNKTKLQAAKGEMLSSALFANGIKIFGHHHHDNSPQGIFCANGQCARCTVIANGVPVKSCMTALTENMIVESVEGLPELPEVNTKPQLADIETIKCDVLVIGGGPAGLSAALEIDNGKVIIVDDKNVAGGKLVLQTHKFFGSVKDSYAGTRGNDIGKMLHAKAEEKQNVEIWLNSTALYVFKDKKIGIVKEGKYVLVEPKCVLNAAGAREKFLRFAGNSLPGVYGAGAFQTLVNRDLIKPTKRLFIIGGGNVGLIAGYHALQAGIDVVGLVEAMPTCGGYKVHADKLKRLGVPIYTRHTILAAEGSESVERIKIAQINDNFAPIKGTEKEFSCDTVLIAVGLESLSEFTFEAEKAGLKLFAAGDALEIAEASSAMFNGKIAGKKVAAFLNKEEADIPQMWIEKANILKSHPGKIEQANYNQPEEGVYPIIHCIQEIPCNPCSSVCPTNAIQMQGHPIMGLPQYTENCLGCAKCVAICPGLAISLIDYRKDSQMPIVTLPYEVGNYPIEKGDKVMVCDINGNVLGMAECILKTNLKAQKTDLIKLKVPKEYAQKVIGVKIQKDDVSKPEENLEIGEHLADEAMVCLCERVTAGQIRELVKKGITDLNQIKAITRAGMGPCGAKTCDNLVKQVMRSEGVKLEDITPNTIRPVFVEVPLGVFAGDKGDE